MERDHSIPLIWGMGTYMESLNSYGELILNLEVEDISENVHSKRYFFHLFWVVNFVLILGRRKHWLIAILLNQPCTMSPLATIWKGFAKSLDMMPDQ